ncbi:MAG: metallophosphoesterase family protein [Verrucomicrobiota bacterium]
MVGDDGPFGKLFRDGKWVVASVNSNPQASDTRFRESVCFNDQLQVISMRLLLSILFPFVLISQLAAYQPMVYKSGYSDKLLFPSKAPDRIILNLTETPETAVAVTWRTDTTVDAGFVEVVEASPTPDYPAQSRRVDATMQKLTVMGNSEPEIEAHYFSAVMDGLEPGKKYTYRVGDGEWWSEWLQFNTTNMEGDGLSLLYFGDAQNDIKSMWSRVIREAFRSYPDIGFMLHAGDLVNLPNSDLEWGQWHEAGGFLHAMVPSMMTPGNHEYTRNPVSLSKQWRPGFSLPHNGVPGLEETCYYVDFPYAKVVSLDSQIMISSEKYLTEQEAWLEELLGKNEKKWVIVTMHHPVYSTAPNRDNQQIRDALKAIFDKYGVDLVLQGHDHAYGRGDTKNLSTGVTMRDGEVGPIYVVSVSGPKQYKNDNAQWMSVSGQDLQLFQYIKILDDTLIYKAFTADAELYDQFELRKSTGGTNRIIE